MKLLSFIACIVFLAIGTYSFGQSAPEVFSMEEAVSYAQQKSISIQQANLDLARAKQQVREYTSIGLPQVNGKVDYNYNINLPTSFLPDFITPAVVGTLEGFQLVPAGTAASIPEGDPQAAQFGVKNSLTMGITASQLVFDGSYFVGLKAAKGLVDMTKKQTHLSKYDIRYNVKKSYLTALIAEENKKVLVRNIENLEKLYAETKAYYENGFRELLDVDRLDLSLANLKSEADMVDRQVQLAYNVLKFQMNYPLDQEIVLTDSLQALMTEPNAEDLSGKISLENRWELKVLQQSEALNELNVKRYKMGYAPSLSAFFTHQYQLQRNDLFNKDEGGLTPITIVGASLNIPIFDGFNKDAKIQMAKIDKSKISLQIKQFQLATELQVINARSIYANAKERLDNQLKNLALAERILKTTKIKYREGVGSSMEITTAEQELYRTQTNHMNALYDVVLAIADLEKALGK